jgi:glycosyltransferase involved in cell wall biosynthesis
MPQPKISVVIPCYNLGRYLNEAVDSVFAQTCDDFEIVIVNDGSTDFETNELLRDYRRPKTRVVTTENRGLAAARNLGIGVATGLYICALDADDVLVPTYFEKASRILDSNPALAFVSTWLETFGDENWIWKQHRCDLATLLAECTVCTAALVRLSSLHAVGGYDELMPQQGYEDWDLWITLVERGFQGTIIPEVLFRYRRRANSMSLVACSGDVHLALMKYLIEKHQTSYDKHLIDVLLRKEADAADVLRANDELERQIDTALLPTIARRREELENLRRKLREGEAARELAVEHSRMAARIDELERVSRADRVQLQELTVALTAASAEAAGLRRSRSWKLTAPLRVVHDFVMHLTAGLR